MDGQNFHSFVKHEHRNMSRQSAPLIHLDCRQYGVSGIGTYIENLIDQFRNNSLGLNFHLLVRSEHKKKLENKLEFQLSEYNETIYSVREQLNWITRINPMGILHVPHYNAPLLFPGKLIITVHDVCHLAMKQYFPGLLKRMYSSLFFKWILVKADHIVTVSNFSKAEIMKYFDIPSEKISVIYNGVSPIFRPVPKTESDPVLKRYQLPEEYLLFLGNIKPHKNIQGVIASYQKALKLRSDLPPLVILGNNDRMYYDIPAIKDYLEADNELRRKVIFTGTLPNAALPSVYSRAILFLFPSFYEGFGLTVLEAMASGTPVITSNVSAIPEVVDGAALLVNPYDNDEIARQLLHLAENTELQKEYIQKGFQQVKRYSWETSAQQHLDVYQKFLRFPATVKPRPSEAAVLPKKKNILFLDQYGDRIGGGQVILLDILEKFQSSGHWNVFVSVPEEGKFTDLLESKGFKASIIKTWQPMWHHEIHVSDVVKYVLSSLKSSFFIGRIIKQCNIEVVYCNGGRTFLNGTFLSTLFSLKLFFHLHLLLEDKQKRAVTMLGRAPGVKSIFAVSKLLENQYIDHSVYKKMCIVSNWVSPELLREEKPPRPEMFSLPIKIGIVGQISKVKGQWAVLNALAESDVVLPIVLSLFGDPLWHENEHWQEVLSMIDTLNERGWEVRYEGFKNDKLEIYDHLDVLLIPSFVPESFGLTAIEAMSREVLVVANRSGALTEIIENGVNGLLYHAENPAELIDILIRISENRVDIAKIRGNALKAVQSNYHPEKQLDLLHKTVLEAVNT